MHNSKKYIAKSYLTNSCVSCSHPSLLIYTLIHHTIERSKVICNLRDVKNAHVSTQLYNTVRLYVDYGIVCKKKSIRMGILSSRWVLNHIHVWYVITIKDITQNSITCNYNMLYFFITNVPLNVIRICFSLSIDCFQATMSGRTKGGRERGESILYARVQCIYMYK